jgi:NAD(P)-dependent dehydrogenase (short-subunit alcohol dehydrogenase family)
VGELGRERPLVEDDERLRPPRQRHVQLAQSALLDDRRGLDHDDVVELEASSASAATSPSAAPAARSTIERIGSRQAYASSTYACSAARSGCAIPCVHENTRKALRCDRNAVVRLEGKVAIVTGAGGGIGRGIAQRFAEEGARVVVNDVDGAAAAEVANAIDAVAIAADVSSAADVDRLFDTTIAELGGVDVLVNNAGLIDVERHFLEADEAWWDRVLAVNLKGQFLCSLRAAKWMARNGGGAIVNLSSGGARAAHRGMVAYDASKGGVEAMTRAMALDLGPYGIRVNALAPGSVDVRGFTPEEAAERGETIPLGRVGTPEDMAGVALFLASDDARYVTGVAISVDGGLIAQQRSPQVDQFPPSRFPRI